MTLLPLAGGLLTILLIAGDDTPAAIAGFIVVVTGGGSPESIAYGGVIALMAKVRQMWSIKNHADSSRDN